MRRSITLADLAAECGVSKATVSKILNDPNEEHPFKAGTRRRVMTAATKLGYRPSYRARALARQRSEAICVLYDNDLPPFGELYRRFFDNVFVEARRHGYHVVFIPAQHAVEDWDRLGLHERVDGCLLLESISRACHEKVTRAGLPVLACNAEDVGDHDSISFDDYDGARQATEHLLELGHRRIHCWLLRSDHYSVRERRRGFLDTMRKAGIDQPERRVVETDDDDIGAFVAGCVGAIPRPTALLVYSHFKAVEVLHLLDRNAVRVPEEISVVTFNDVYPVEFSIPALTTVHCPLDEMGCVAAQRIFAKIDQPDLKCERIVLPETLVVRASTASPMM